MPRFPARVVPFLLPLLSPLRSPEVRAQTPPLGPLGAEEGAPLQRLGYTPMVEVVEPVAVGSLRTDVWIGYSNIFEQDSTSAAVLYLDMERMLTALTVRYGLADGLEVGGRITVETDWGGFLDGFMVSFHEALGLGVLDRPRFPKGAYADWLRDGRGHTLVDVPEHHLAVDDVRLFAKWRVLRAGDGRGAVSIRAVARLPTAQPTIGSERADLGLMAMGNVALCGVWLHAMAGGSTVRRAADMRDVLRGHQWYAMAGVELPFHPGLSGVVEFTGSTPLLRHLDAHDVDGAPTNVVFGLVGVTGMGWRWEAGLQEDWPPGGPSLDFTLQLALGHAW